MGHLVPDGVKQGAQGAAETVIPAALLNPLLVKKTAFDKIYSLIIDFVVRLFCQFAEQVHNQTLSFVAVKKREQQRTDKCKHDNKS